VQVSKLDEAAAGIRHALAGPPKSLGKSVGDHEVAPRSIAGAQIGKQHERILVLPDHGLDFRCGRSFGRKRSKVAGWRGNNGTRRRTRSAMSAGRRIASTLLRQKHATFLGGRASDPAASHGPRPELQAMLVIDHELSRDQVSSDPDERDRVFDCRAFERAETLPLPHLIEILDKFLRQLIAASLRASGSADIPH